ncbi:hypothetical protein BM1_05133 [Bipolaris maydis]|nr:hypothetical protein BM1_05133 [Bipolaris maydis]
MKFTTAFLLAASVNVITALTASFDGCFANSGTTGSYANPPCTLGTCSFVSCQTACHKAGTVSSPDDWYLAAEYNGPAQNSCSFPHREGVDKRDYDRYAKLEIKQCPIAAMLQYGYWNSGTTWSCGELGNEH